MKTGRSHEWAALAALAVAGVLAGRYFGKGPDRAETADRSMEVSARPDRPGRASPTGKDSAHDVETLLRLRRKTSAGDTEEAREMARLSTAALKELITSQLAIIAREPVGPELFPRYEAIRLACKELFRREGAAAYEWAVSLPEGTGRRAVVEGVVMAAARQEPLLAKQWLDQQQKANGDKWGPGFSHTVLEGALARGGAKELLKVMEIGGVHNYCPAVPEPEGFDFAGFWKTLDGRMNLSEPLRQWARQDPEAAWSAVKDGLSSADRSSPATNPVPMVLEAAVAKQGTQEGVAWMMARLAELPAAAREAGLRDVTGAPGGLSIGTTAALAAALPEQDRSALVKGFLKPIGLITGDTQERSLAALAAIPREEMLAHLQDTRTTVRASLESEDQENSGNMELRKFFEIAHDRFSLTDAEMERIHGK